MHCLRRLHYIKFDCLRLWPWRMFALSEHSLVTSDKGGGKCFCPCSFVCLSVSKISQKRAHGFGWKCCMSTYVGTWTNWLTFEPDPDYSPDAGTGLLSPISYKCCNAEFYIGKIPRTRIGGVVSGAFLKWFYSLSCRITVVGGACALPSVLLVIFIFVYKFLWFLPCREHARRGLPGSKSWQHHCPAVGYHYFLPGLWLYLPSCRSSPLFGQ